MTSTPPISQLTEDPTKVIQVSFGGRFFRCSQRTYAHLLKTQAALSRRFPKAYIRVIQGSYNTGVALSAGTHDRDATLDVQVVGLSWQEAESFLRAQGWAAWWRHTGSWASQSMWHIHMTSLGAVEAGCVVGYLIDGGRSLYGRTVASSQIADYYAHRDALVTHAPDPTWHPANIARTVFNYRTWLEANMQLTDKQLNDIADRVVAKLLATEVGPRNNRQKIRTIFARMANTNAIVRSAKSAVLDAVNPPASKR